MNLLATFLVTAERHGDRPAVIAGDGTTISYANLAKRSSSLAADWRRQGVERGDRVLLAMPVGIDLYAAIAALWRLGAAIIFPEPAMGLGGLHHAVRMAKPKAVLTAGPYRILPYIIPELWRVDRRIHVTEGAPGAEVFEDVEDSHPALISFTSGSTGAPKGIVRSHGFLTAQNACVAGMLRSDNGHEIDLVAFPVFVIANLAMGMTSVLPNWKLTRHDRADAHDIVRLIAGQNITRALIPPSICATLSKGNADPGLQAIFTGGGPIFPDLMRAMQRRMPNTSIMAVYGSTEAEPIAHQCLADIASDDWQQMETGGGLLAGAPVPQTQTRIIDDEIVVTGDHVNKGYLHGHGDAENKLMIDGQIWHRTGDAGRLDADGRLWLRGRLSAKINGHFPFEIEVAARSWPGVKAAALLPYNGQAVLAIAGDVQSRTIWEENAARIGTIKIVAVKDIPLDKRHRSKIDYAKLGPIVAKLLR